MTESRFAAEQKRFVNSILGKHQRISKYLAAFHSRQSRSFGYRQANIKLREVSESLIFDSYQTAALDDESICNIAKARAEHCDNILKREARRADASAVADKLTTYCSANGVLFPLKVVRNDSPGQIAGKIMAAAARVSDDKWWRRQLRKVTARRVESVLREIGGVRSGAAPYISNYSFQQWKQSQYRNTQAVAAMEAVTMVDGEEVAVALDECAASSISNPINRRNELMVRMRGYEEAAQGMGFAGLFLTLTAPSKFHAIAHGRGLNAKFCSASPADAMAYLNGVWARIRAEWAREGIKCFGFRVAEPHHDGTPHFHFMLFLSAEQQEKAKRIFGEHALAEDGDEPGAQENRWDAVDIDPEKGTASGYIAKYVAKNIDGFAVGTDEEGDCQADEGAARARAWASIWGIRQFQPIGSVSVTVWRELRRRCDLFEIPDADIKPLREAADRGDWARFVELMGGPLAARDELALRPLYQEAEQFDNQYGEAVKRMIGLWLQNVGRAMARCALVTRDRVWLVRRREPELEEAEAKPPPLDL